MLRSHDKIKEVNNSAAHNKQKKCEGRNTMFFFVYLAIFYVLTKIINGTTLYDANQLYCLKTFVNELRRISTSMLSFIVNSAICCFFL